MFREMALYLALASAVVALHALFIAWIAFGALLTRRRPLLRDVHIVSLIWGVLVEVGPWPCPLTVVENWLEVRSGGTSYQAGFLLHYLDKLVYPNLPPRLLTVAAVLVCLVNLVTYAVRYTARWSRTGR